MSVLCPYALLAKPVITFCEPNLCSHIVQPANAWSNLAFLVVGVLLAFLSRKEQNLLPKLFGPLAIFIGLASFMYHASYTFVGQMLDLLSMFLLISFILIVDLRRTAWPFFSTGNSIVLFIVLNIVSTAVMYFVRVIGGFNIGILIFALQVALVLILEVYLLTKSHFTSRMIYLLGALAIAAAGCVVWVYDYKRIWCDAATFHFINGHAVWHVLTAISLLFIYYHFRVNFSLNNNTQVDHH